MCADQVALLRPQPLEHLERRGDPLGQEAPSPITVSDVLVELPAREPPDGGEIGSPMFR